MRRIMLAALLLGGCRPATTSPAAAANATLPAAALLPRPLAVGQPDFTATTRGRVALVDLWATWCEACTESIPRVRHLAQTYGSQDLVVIGVNVGEDAEAVRSYTVRAEMAYPQFLDPEFAFADALGAREVPTVLVLDRSGRIVLRARELDQAVLEQLERSLSSP